MTDLESLGARASLFVNLSHRSAVPRPILLNAATSADYSPTMHHSRARRAIVVATTAAVVVSTRAWSAVRDAGAVTHGRFRALELSSGGRLGVSVLDTENGATSRHRADERFAMCSTFKIFAAAAILKRSAGEKELLQQSIQYGRSELATYSPVTQKYVGEGMTVAQLCAAAIQYSDNTAANLILKLLGGPAAVTAFARSIGDNASRLDRWEPELNSAIPGDLRDTSTPNSMANSMRLLALGDALGQFERLQLLTWLKGNTTGDARIRAGVEPDWEVGDKTGSGDFGTTNDVAVVWPPARQPLVVAVYFTQRQRDAKPRSDVLASATRIALQSVFN
jgi:beta-lactamase class A